MVECYDLSTALELDWMEDLQLCERGQAAQLLRALPDAPTKSGWSTAKIIPVTRLKALDLNADISFGQLTLSKLPIQNAALKASSKAGVLTLDNLSGSLY